MFGSAAAAADVSSQLSGKAEDYVNDSNVETAWAIRAYEHARVHMNLICAVDPAQLRLSKCDDEIYKKFRQWFEDFEIEDVSEESLKSEAAKTKWREFIEMFKEDIEDFNYGTLLRLGAGTRYDSAGTILVTRTQFLAIEIARNKEGINSKHRADYSRGEEGTGF